MTKAAPPQSGDTGHTRRLAQDFRDAIERLKDGSKIKNRELRRRAAAGKLRINISTVAREAGHSRTLIATADSRFPDIREEIMAFRSARGKKSDRTRSIESVRGALRDEKSRAALLASENLALLRKCKSLELRLAQRDHHIRNFQLGRQS